MTINLNARRYLISGSSFLENELLKLGYTYVKTIGGGRNEVKEFRKNDRLILTGYWKITITQILKDEKHIELYSGGSINSETLKFLTDRNPIELKNT